MHENLNISSFQLEPDNVAVNHGAHYTMRMLQNFPVYIATFLQKNKDDPTVKLSSFMYIIIHSRRFPELVFTSQVRLGHLPKSAVTATGQMTANSKKP